MKQPETSARALAAPERLPPCALHPQAPSRTTCGGCGLFLCATCAAEPADEGPRCGQCSSVGHPIPWEDRSRPRGRAFLSTLRAFLAPDALFAQAPWTGGLRGPLAFAVAAALVGALGKAVFTLLSTGMMMAAAPGLLDLVAQTLGGLAPPREAALLKRQLAALPQAFEQLGAMLLRLEVLGLLLNPLSTAVGVFVMAALSHPIARRLGGQGSFEASFRVIAYATAAKVLGVVPGVGGMLAFVGGLVLVAVGMRRAHGISGGKAFMVAAWWIPVALLIGVIAAAWIAGLLMRVLAG